MNYVQAMDYIQEVGQYGSVLGLDSIRELLRRLDNPEKQLQFVHVGGTNGKGSTSTYIASILGAAGYKVGRYISPVLITYCECIQITNPGGNNEQITEEQVAKQLTRIKAICTTMVAEGLPHPTTFEVETAMAFLEFVEQQCDVVVLEVGLGGRLDATNVVTNVLCSVLTSISMDHMAFLGNTIEEIAREKAGIIKSGCPVVSYSQLPSVDAIIKEECEKMSSGYQRIHPENIQIVESTIEGSRFSYGKLEGLETRLLGEHQLKNAALAIETIQVLRNQGYHISEEDIYEGIRNATWFGRLSVLQRRPDLIVDGAHNEEAAQRLRDAIQMYYGSQKGIFVFGVFADKEYDKILDIMLPMAKKVYAITPNNSRGLDSSILCKKITAYGIEVVDAKTAENGMHLALQEAKLEDYILCFGSLSFLGEVKQAFDNSRM